MTKLELLNAELERQDRELAFCFEQLRALDPALSVSVSTEWMEEFEAEPAPVIVPAAWAIRA